MLLSGEDETAGQYQSTKQQQPQTRQGSGVARAVNLRVELMIRKSFHRVDLYKAYWFYRTYIFVHALSFALRALGFSSISLNPGAPGRRVSTSTTSRAPRAQTGKRGGHSQ